MQYFGFPSSDIDEAIKTLFENGGLPATPFATKALMTASALIDGKYAQVTDDTVNNGLYVKTAGAWVKSNYDPLAQSKDYADVKIKQQANATALPEKIQLKSESFILADAVLNWELGQYISDTGAIATDATKKITGYIPTKKGDIFYTPNASSYRINTYDKDKGFIEIRGQSNGIPLEIEITKDTVAYVRISTTVASPSVINLTIGKRNIDWLNATPENIYDAMFDILTPAEPTNNNLLFGVPRTEGFYLDGSGNPLALSTVSYTDYVAVKPNSKYVLSLGAAVNGCEYNSSKGFVKSIPIKAEASYYDHEFTTSANTYFLRVNVFESDPRQSLIDLSVQRALKIAIKTELLNAWRGKKIAWYGTSIPAGYPKHTSVALQDVWSHANLAVHDLGATIINKCVPNGGISGTTGLSFVDIADAINYQNSLLDIMGTAQNPDLVVFDYGVNDYAQHRTDINNYDPLDPLDSGNTGTKTKINTRNTNTFIGAYNFVIDAMLTKDPTMKFCFVTHFSDDNVNPAYATTDFYAKLNVVIEAIADYWAAPVLRLHEKTNYRSRNGFDSITPIMPDTIHPASGDGSSVQSLRAIMRDFLISIG